MTVGNSNVGPGSGVVLGNPVTGDDFFGREAELSELLDQLSAGTHLHVTAPRRIGKTSLLLEAQRRLGEGYIFLFVDVQGCEAEVDAISKLLVEARKHEKLGHRVLDGFKSIFRSTERVEEIDLSSLKIRLRDALVADWRGKADDALMRLAGSETPVVVWFDELPLLVANLLALDKGGVDAAQRPRTRALLSWLREASIRHAKKIRFVLSGSVGLKPLVERNGLSDTLNTFFPFPLGPWSCDEALGFLRDRAPRNGFAWTGGADEHLLAIIRQPIPYHVQILVHELALDARRRGATEVSPGDVRRVYEKISGSQTGEIDLSTYQERLRRAVSDDLLAAAEHLLTEAAVADQLTFETAKTIVGEHEADPRAAQENLRFLLGVLEHDGYLEREGERYIFSSHLLRDWWRRRFGYGYQPVSKR